MNNKKKIKKQRKIIKAQDKKLIEADAACLMIVDELQKLRMLVVAWNMTEGVEATPVEQRLVEEAAAIETNVREGKIKLPVDIDTLRGSVLA